METEGPPIYYGQPGLKGSPGWTAVTAAVVLVILGAILFPVFATSPHTRGPYCLMNVKQVGLCLAMYQYDYDGRFPRSGRWYDDEGPYMKNADLRCPAIPTLVDGVRTVGYGFNDRLSRVPADCLGEPDHTVAVFDSYNLFRNASDAVASLVPGGRHGGGNQVDYADAHAKWIKWPLDPGIVRPEVSGHCFRTGKPDRNAAH